MGMQQAEQVQRLLLRDHHRLFAENLQPKMQGGAQVLQVQVVGRANHQQIQRVGLCQRLDGGIGPADPNRMRAHRGKAGGGVIDIADDLKPRYNRRKDAGEIAKTEAKADDADFHDALRRARISGMMAWPEKNTKPLSRSASGSRR